MTQLTEHFSLEELTFSETATRHGISNKPDVEVLAHLKVAAAGMEKVRALLGYPIIVSSGYRSPAVNARVGGSGTSAHCLGYAVDFRCPDFGSPLDVARAIEKSNIAYDQIIHEYGSWCHISFDPRMRGAELTIGHGTGYMPGLVHL